MGIGGYWYLSWHLPPVGPPGPACPHRRPQRQPALHVFLLTGYLLSTAPKDPPSTLNFGGGALLPPPKKKELARSTGSWVC